ncbi:MAG: hypothetical protein KGS61_12050 [Verrucomicrobia bacterium]|nr:hypothetical protein [Verrucomicrobiota bacterium]
MRRILHIRTRPDDALAQTVATQQRADAQCQVETVDLTVPEPDYDALLESIFDADSIEVW